jgi:hypothetical protein
VLESPVYGEPGFESPSRYYRSGWRSWCRRLAFVIGFNPWVPIALALMGVASFTGHVSVLPERAVLAWTLLCLTFALITTLVPALRCLGQGYLYGYNGAFPAAVMLGQLALIANEHPGAYLEGLFQVGLILGGIACLAGLAAFFRAMARSRTARIDADLDRAIEALARLPQGAVMCLPQHWHDAVAWRTGKPVLFGGHGYGFKRLEPFFPRVLVPVRQLMGQYDIRYLLTLEGYCNARFMADLPAHERTEFGRYVLCRFDEPLAGS